MAEQAAQALAGAVRCGPFHAAVALLSSERFAQEVDRVGVTGTNALHLAVWRNHLQLVEALLAAGAATDTVDKESGWTALHRALYFGNLRIAAALLEADASLTQPDWRGRLPLDLLSEELKPFLPDGGPGEVYTWGNGTNYTLGTGSTDVQATPARVDSLHGVGVVSLSAAKFHSAAVTEDGALYTWGWGRGGRLGHPEAHIHSGESAVISPRLVASLGRRQVVAVAAAKHHTLLCTSAGEAYTMGSNRHGQLGYAIDTQAEPRRVAALARTRIVAVAAANKHSVAVSSSGGVYTWGSNALGQLGYGTFDSATSAAPRLVEALKGRCVVAAAAAKRHTVVLTVDGDVFTWGHRGVSPRRVQLAGVRDAVASDGKPLRFHRDHADVARPEAVAVCAGAAHSSALTSTGVVLTWRSADPALLVQEVGGLLAGRRIVAVSAGKYRTAAVTDQGDVYCWEGRSDFFPADGRQSGSGSKKKGGGKGRAIPGAGRAALPGSIDCGSPSVGSGSLGGASYGSYGSATRPKGSFLERVYSLKKERERDGEAHSGPASSAPRHDTPGGSHRASPQGMDSFGKIVPERVMGLKRAGMVAVGEKHSIALQRWNAVALEGLPPLQWLQQRTTGARGDRDGPATPRGSDIDEAEAALVSPEKSFISESDQQPPLSPAPASTGPPPLQYLCEEVVGRQLVDPRTALQVLEYADLAGAASLRAYCLAVAVCNLDTVLIEARGAFEDLPPHLLAEVEGVLHAHLRSTGKTVMPAAEGGLQVEHSCGSSSRARDVASSILQPGLRPTAAAPKLSDISDDEDGLSVMGRQEVAVEVGQVPSAAVQQRPGSSFKDDDTASAEHAAHRLLRSLSKKLQQIEALEARTALGEALDTQQLNKMGQKPVVLSALAALEGGMAPEDVHVMLQAATEQAAAPPVASAAGGSAPASAAKPPKAETPGARGSGTPGTGSSRAKGKTRSRRRLQSETTVLAAELSVATIGTSPEASVPDPLLFAASPPPDRQVPAFGGQPRTHIVGFAASTPTAQPKAAARSAERQPRRTGALSMFLRGELDAPATATAEASSPSGPRAGSPAWAAKPSAPPAAAPLKDILSQQAAASKSTTPRPGTPGPAPKGSSTKGPRSGAQDSGDASASSLRVPLAAFLGGGPAAPAPAPATGPAWGAVSGASPPLSKPSLRQIQEEQESRRKAAAAPPMWGTSPPTTARQSASIPSAWIAAKGPSASGGAGGGAGPSLLGTSPGGSVVLGTSPSGRVFAASVPPQSKWYLPEDQEHEQRRKKSLKAIQAEESAMKELARKYGGANVRIVKSGAPLVKQ